jgi:hypothetical protein
MAETGWLILPPDQLARLSVAERELLKIRIAQVVDDFLAGRISGSGGG